MGVRYAVGLPNVGEFGNPTLLVDLAVAAEDAGWDGVFCWDHLLYHEPGWPVANPTVVAAAIAARTTRIRLGVLMTALPRRRAQVVAREAVSLDRLSGGRLVFGAGLGSMDREYRAFGEPADRRSRAAALDSALAALVALWSGEEVELVPGEPVRMLPTPVQQPRIPIWCAGGWPARAPFRRAARYDGVMPVHPDFRAGRTMPPEVLAEILDVVYAERAGLAATGVLPDGVFDVAIEGATEPTGAAETVVPYAEVGLTWWVEAMGWWRGGVAAAMERIAAGPPR